MNVPMSRVEFEALPFRDDLVNEPVQGAFFRAHDHPGCVFQAQTRSRSDWSLWGWWCFRVELPDAP